MHEIKVKTKPEELCAQLTAMAQRLGPGAKLSSGRTLSSAYGVSRTTLQLALDRLEAEKVISRRPGSGVYVSDSLVKAARQRNVALICNFAIVSSAGHSAFWDHLVQQLQQRAELGGEVCQLHLTNPVGEGVAILQESFRAELRAGRVHGALAIGVDREATTWIINQDLPVVSFASWSNWMVRFDEVALIRLGVQQLKQRGCRRIGLWVPTGPAERNPDRLPWALRTEAIFREAMEAEGLNFDSQLVRCGTAPTHQPEAFLDATPQEQGYETAKAAFGAASDQWPDGVLSTNDMVTHGALAALRRLGVRPGTDVEIASHANRGSSLLMGHDEELTLLEVDPRALVRTMFSMLETLMDGGTPASEQVLIQPQARRQA